MNRTIKEASVRCFHYDGYEQRQAHLSSFIQAYNFAKRLKTLEASLPMSSSAGPGQLNRHDSLSTRSIKCRD